MDKYDKYEKKCEQIRTENERLLAEFETSLKSSGLSAKTINKHLINVDFYINDFLLYDDTCEAKNGANNIGMFLGYWFIKKAMWANEASIKSNATSIKKFYEFLFEKNLIAIDDLAELNNIIKADMPEWLATMRRYQDPSIESMEDVWGY